MELFADVKKKNRLVALKDPFSLTARPRIRHGARAPRAGHRKRQHQPLGDSYLMLKYFPKSSLGSSVSFK